MRGLPSIASAFASLEDAFSTWSSFFIVIFPFIFSTSLVAQSSSEDPEYLWISKADLPSVTVSDMNTEDLTISIATDPQGNVYALSFGDGVDKRDANGVMIEAGFISSGELDSPLDIAIDEEGYIYVADYLAQGTSFEDNGKIKVFDPQGNYLPERTIPTSFYRPLGVDVNSDKVFVAEFNDGNSGPERTQLSRIRVYDKISKEVLEETYQVQVPYRIAVNSQEQIYVSQAGNNDPDVLVFNSNLALLGELPNIVSPGSVVVDNLDYVHVLEYENRIDFSEFINFVDLGLDDILDIAEQIKRGSDNEDFVIKIFDPSNSYLKSIVNRIDFPVDLTFNDCNRMYVNNSEVFGSTIPIFGFFPSRLEFDLEIYERTPSLDIEAPIARCIPDGKEFELVDGEVTISVEDINDGSTDNCGIASMELSQSTFSTPGKYEIKLTVTDFDGNSDSCLTTIEVIGTAPELEIDCPSNQAGSLNENCEFIVENYTDLAGTDSDAVVTQSPAPGTVITGETDITLTASLNGETVSCNFKLFLEDNTPPEIQCFTNITGVYDSSKGFSLQDYTWNINLTDNCDPAPVISQDPPEGTLVFTDESTITFTATDASGNEATCTVDVILTDIPESLSFTSCPDPQWVPLDENCQVVVPDFTGAVITNYTDVVITQDPPAGTVLEGITSLRIEIKATRGEEEAYCHVIFQAGDRTDPVIIKCPDDQTVPYDPEVGFVLPDYTSLAQVSDSCGEVIFSQAPNPGNLIFEDMEVWVSAHDPSGNNVTCRFMIFLEEYENPSIGCPEPSEIPSLNLNAECRVEAPEYSDLISTSGFQNQPHFVQTEKQNINTLSVVIKVYDGEGGPFVGECSFDVTLRDTTPPIIDCPGTISLSSDAEGKYFLPDFSNRVSDTCDSTPAIVQTPPAGEITSGGTVTLSAVDDSGNVSQTCEFEVVLLQEGAPDFDCPAPEDLPEIELEEDCSYVTPNFNELLSNFRNFDDSPLFVMSRELIGTVLHVNLKVYDGEEREALFVKECSFQIQLRENFPPQAICVQAISIRLSEDGSRTLSPEEVDNGSIDGCGNVSYELSRNTFTTADLENSPIEVELTVTDVYGNTDTCIVLVTVEPYDPGEPAPVTCITSVTLPLGASGEAQLDLEQLYEGELGPDGTVSADKDFFTCSDLGVQTITLSYTGNTTGSCTIEVTVVDEIAPTPIAADLEISLDENGAASISAEDLNDGSMDNCGTAALQFTADRTSFSCADVGTNPVTFTVTDTSGNSASVNVNVIVNDPLNSCPVDPVDPPEESFVFLFPNPSRGQVQIATSTDIVLDRVEIFDIRGRFLDALELVKNSTTRSYHLDLQKYQTGVYTLKLYTGEREYIRRAIITTF